MKRKLPIPNKRSGFWSVKKPVVREANVSMCFKTFPNFVRQRRLSFCRENRARPLALWSYFDWMFVIYLMGGEVLKKDKENVVFDDNYFQCTN